MSATRRLAAILAADVVGYSRLMERDETGTLAALKARRKDILQPAVAKHHGRIVKVMGDAVLVEFGSAVNAVACAVELQAAMDGANAGMAEDRRILLRVGINLGDVMVEGSDLYGDGVNIAARLEGLSEPGGLCISASVFEHVNGKVPCSFVSLGPQTLKNIDRPIEVYRLAGSEAPRPPGPAVDLPLPDKPSIAVLPFQNMSGDPEQEYFADGMVDEIITALSRIRWLFVIARNSSFTYKGRAVDVKQVGRELGVRYVLEGSVRKAANRVRIIGQLIDSTTGAHLWADRFDGTLEDIFDLQDHVAASVVGAIGPKLERAEIERVRRKPTESLDAYDCYLRGIQTYYPATREATDDMLRLLYRAIELDPDFAAAYGVAAWCYMRRKANAWMVDRPHESAEAVRLARRAAELGKDDALALAWAGQSLAYVGGELEDAVAFTDRALALNPNLAVGWGGSGWLRVLARRAGRSNRAPARAMRLSPLDLDMRGFQSAAAHAHFFAGRYDEASSWAAKALRENPDHTTALRMAAASHALAGRPEEAQKALARLRELVPALRVSNLRDVLGPYRRPEDIARYEEGLRKAGVPE